MSEDKQPVKPESNQKCGIDLEKLAEINKMVRGINLQPALINLLQTLNDTIRPFEELRNKFNQPLAQMKYFSEILERYSAFEETFNKSLAPLIIILLKGIQKFPEDIRTTVLILGENGWYLDPELSIEAGHRIAASFSSGNSQLADKAMVEYYEGRLEGIENYLINAMPHRSSIIHAAFDAHRRGQYELSTPVLLTQVDGICKERTNAYLFMRKDGRPETAYCISQMFSDRLRAAFLSPLSETLPILKNRSERTNETTELNRHLVIHGDSTNYGTKTNSLKTISLINYICYFFVLEKENIDK